MFRILVVLLMAASLAIGNGQGKGRGKGRHGPQVVHGRSATNVAVQAFVVGDRRIIHDYVAGYPGGLPPGLAKWNGALPPGLEKQLRRNGTLPPGLEKRIVYFPPELERRLSPLEPGFRRGFIGPRAVIINPKTLVILDTFTPIE